MDRSEVRKDLERLSDDSRAVSDVKEGIVAQTARPKSIDTERTKTSVSLAPKAKFKLATLKAELRLKGYSVSESDVMEALILSTDAATVARLLKSR